MRQVSLLESWLGLVLTGVVRGAFLLSKFWKKFFKLVLSGALVLEGTLGLEGVEGFIWVPEATDLLSGDGVSSCLMEGVDVLLSTS